MPASDSFSAFLIPRTECPHAAQPKALLVTEDRAVDRSLAGTLAVEGLALEVARTPERAWTAVQQDEYTLLLADLDLGTPIMGLLAFLKKTQPRLPFVALASEERRSAGIHALRLGATSYALKPVLPEEVTLLVSKALHGRQTALRLQECRQRNRQLHRGWENQRTDLHQRELEVAERLANVIQCREGESRRHVERVGAFSSALGSELGWRDEALGELRTAASLHDVGMVGLPDQVLRNAGRLTGGEFELIKTHPLLGAAIIGESRVPVLETAREISLGHHERWDGSGYPHGLVGEEIPLCARIVAVADVYDALNHPRAYRPAVPEEESLAFMASQRGTGFDPEVFDCFMDILPQLQAIRSELSEVPVG